MLTPQDDIGLGDRNRGPALGRSTRILGIAFVLLALGTGACAFGASSGEQDAVIPPPEGKESALRIEPVNAEIPCGTETGQVRLYLDDLVQRPSALDKNAPSGIAGFQVILRYDPAILRLGAEPRIDLGESLDSFDEDADGITRSFFTVRDVDDFAGRAIIGAGSIGKQEEGPDAMAHGAPILLMTIHFQTVGHGSSEITISQQEDDLPAGLDRSGIIDPSGEMYEPLMLRNSALLVTDGQCPEAPPITPRPTPAPAEAEQAWPTIQIPTPRFLTPMPAEDGGRDDCPASWSSFAEPDGHFSLCYPSHWRAVMGPPEADLGTVIMVSGEHGGFVTAYWRGTSYFSSPGFTDRCAMVPGWKDTAETAVALLGRSVTACAGDASERPHEAPGDLPQLDGTFAEVQLGVQEGYLVVFLVQPRGDGVAEERADGATILESISVTK